MTQLLISMTPVTRTLFAALLLVLAFMVSLAAAHGKDSSRQSVSLDGTWQIAEGKLDVIPDTFSRTVPVPGLVDLAEPAFLRPPLQQVWQEGARIEYSSQVFKDPERDAYWYRREFNLDSVAPHVRLKIHKAMFGTKVFLNGKEIGKHYPSFTPAYYDVTDTLKAGRNEILIRIGADFQSVLHKATIPYDKEKKYPYFPGIFDSVELIGTDKLFIENIQTVPDIDTGKIRAQIRLVNKGTTKVSTSLHVRVTEFKSGKAVGSASVASVEVPAGGDAMVDATVEIADCKLWSPESPFLYVFEAATESDRLTTRFGMRTFRFNQETRFAELNGKPYFMRGSNFTLYRFFEDDERKALPWDRDWVQLLHERVKGMHWNTIRYCIGFPPEFWYDIADEVGILIQDEFPIWMMSANEANTWLDTDQLVAEYTDWMRERWNHPCVVIWDACNETASYKTGAAITRVRGLDLSNRPWDNAWSPPNAPGDSLELHPYHFWDPDFRLSHLATLNRELLQGPQGPYGIINNEYGWLWLDRKGTPSPLTYMVYKNVLGPDSTAEQRFYVYATYLAAQTEWFRAHRQCAGVLHFAMLAYSRPGGDTSDHWANVEKLEWEPFFFQYVRDAFHPVGLMVDYWNDHLVQGRDITASVPVILINDLEKPWKGPVKCRIVKDGKVVWERETEGTIEPYGTATVTFEVTLPQETGAYRLEASITGNDQKPVTSVRDFSVLHPTMVRVPIRDAFASSSYDVGSLSYGVTRYGADKTLTANKSGYWSSAFRDNEWITFNFGEQRQVGRLIIHWQHADTKKFNIKVSSDAETWTEVFKQDNGQGGAESVKFDPVECRYLRINCLERGHKQWGNAIYYVEVFAE